MPKEKKSKSTSATSTNISKKFDSDKFRSNYYDEMLTGKPANSIIQDSGSPKYVQKLLVATPTTGLVRMEWVVNRYNQTIPTNWSKTDMIQYMSGYVPLRYTVADAQNLAVRDAITRDFEWLLFVEHDTIPPVDALLKFTDYMDHAKYPVVSGLYFTRSVPPEPMVYRGRGNHYFRNWKISDKIWVDGVPTGMLLLNTKLLAAVWDDSAEYRTGDGQLTRRVFDTPSKTWFNEERGAQETLVGTSDLDFCTRVIKGNYLAKAGWPKIQRQRYPFLIDTNIYCKHINPDGTQFPIEFPNEFLPEDPETYEPREIKG